MRGDGSEGQEAVVLNLLSHLHSVEEHPCPVRLEEGLEVLCHRFLLRSRGMSSQSMVCAY